MSVANQKKVFTPVCKRMTSSYTGTLSDGDVIVVVELSVVVASLRAMSSRKSHGVHAGWVLLVSSL